MTALNDTRRQLLGALREQVRCIEGAACPRHLPTISSGCPALDTWLPQGGFHGGQLVEWFAARPASGAGTLALLVARQAATEGRSIVVIDRHGKFYPPAAAAWQLDLRRLVIVQPRHEVDAMWALDQALRCPAVAAVWAHVARIEPRCFRRLQLAAEESGSLGLLLRPPDAARQPSWSDVQLLVEPLPSVAAEKRGQTSLRKGPGPFFQPNLRRWRVQLLRCRGAATEGQILELEMDESTGVLRNVDTTTRSDHIRHETGTEHLAAQLAHPTPRRRSARA